jgi:two-component system cell cycle response regulator DivK
LLKKCSREIQLDKVPMAKKILIVEDNLDLIDYLQDLLHNLKYDAIVATDGKQAVDMAADQRPDLILMDIVLPEMNGLEAARRIRQKPESCSIPILAVTARVLPQAREQCLQSGCNDYISKPFTPKELASRIEKLLQ